MRIAVTSDYHFRRGTDGIYTDATYPYEFWLALREVFDEVIVIARVGFGLVAAGHLRADGPGVRFAAVPDFVGGRGGLRHSGALAAIALAAVGDADVVLLRAPGVIATAAHVAALARRRPYGVEIGGDPFESLTAASAGLARFATIAAGLLRVQLRDAIATRYVTEGAIQRRYPPPRGRFTTAASDLELPDALFDEPPVAITDRDVLELIWVGALARPYKGVDVLLAALARTARPHRLTLVGDGVLREALTADAATRGLADRVRFAGMVGVGAPVFALLRAADLFVLPSRTEGLPRALIEAMAVGLPCLATRVGGVPELLAADALVDVDDVDGLARAIDAVAAAPPRRRAMAAANQARARGFRLSVRRQRMDEFYRALRTAAGA